MYIHTHMYIILYIRIHTCTYACTPSHRVKNESMCAGKTRICMYNIEEKLHMYMHTYKHTYTHTHNIVFDS